MACMRNDVELRCWPRFMQTPSARERRDDVIAAVNDTSRDVFEFLSGLLQEPSVFFKEALIDEEMAFDAGESVGEIIFFEPLRPAGWALDRDGFTFPARPRLCGLATLGAVIPDQAPVKGVEQVIAFVFRNRGDIAVI